MAAPFAAGSSSEPNSYVLSVQADLLVLVHCYSKECREVTQKRTNQSQFCLGFLQVLHFFQLQDSSLES